MRFQEKLKKNTREQIWQEYCGFLDLSMSEYMYIQQRLMDKQVESWAASELGRKLLFGKRPTSVDEFRLTMPLTTYSDYADILLAKDKSKLPGDPIIWLQTTWEGGLRPIKVAPYTREMLDRYRHNVIAITMLASGREKGDFNVKKGDRVLYGGAPLPYVTGLIPSVLDEDINFTWLPDTNANSKLSFGERIKKGFSMAMNGGVDFFFAIGSVANYITESFGKSSGSTKKLNISVAVAFRWLKAKYICRRDNRKLVPGDVFRLKGFVCTGTDAKAYKSRLEKTWGVTPIEIAAGTESTCVATGTWEDNGMVFFPDSCFYEFIPEVEMNLSLQDETYVPRTCLMDEVIAGESYELVISVLHGGAFMRYRIGDVYHCISTGINGELPRFTYVDRVPTIIDIAGFTRMSETSITEVIRMSKLGIGSWIAKKEFDENNNPFLHMYIEVLPRAQESDVTRLQVLREHLSSYFRYFDSDYSDLKKLLNMEPLRITVIKYGTIDTYQKNTGRIIPRINPSAIDISEIVKFQTRPRSTHSIDEEASGL